MDGWMGERIFSQIPHHRGRKNLKEGLMYELLPRDSQAHLPLIVSSCTKGSDRNLSALVALVLCVYPEGASHPRASPTTYIMAINTHRNAMLPSHAHTSSRRQGAGVGTCSGSRG